MWAASLPISNVIGNVSIFFINLLGMPPPMRPWGPMGMYPRMPHHMVPQNVIEKGPEIKKVSDTDMETSGWDDKINKQINRNDAVLLIQH